MWCAVERANSLFIMIALDSETKHRRQKEPAQISKHIACPHTEACLFKPSLCACSQLLDLIPNFLMLGGSTWTLLLTLCSPARMGSSYKSEQESHFFVTSSPIEIKHWARLSVWHVYARAHTIHWIRKLPRFEHASLNDSSILFICFLHFTHSVVCLFIPLY